jgi:transmembrane 9 superfamily protein 2/4
MWRRCQGDVFRRPDHPLLLSVLVGIGLSLLIEFLIASFLYAFIGKYVLGLLLVFHPLFALCNGIISSRLFLLFHGTDWGFLTLASALSMPTFLLSVFAIIDGVNP